ncbi:MAG TPA: TetR/AcrR family transcriptional regulator [Pirellulales bacterium]
MPSETRKKLVDTAIKRFYRDGFRNVGIDQILSDVGISKTAFYKHFECKEDLMLAALSDHDRWVQNTFREMVRERGGHTGAGQLLALFDVVDTILATDGFQGCIFVNVAIEFPLPHEPAHIAAARSKLAMEDLVAEIATEAGASDPRALAQELCLIMEGVYVTRHVSGNPLAVEIARSIARRVIDGHLPVTV